MKSNLYSHEWQIYVGDYDKKMYDIKLHDGTIVENCYPNAGIFHENFNGKRFLEAEVAAIKISDSAHNFWFESEIATKTISELELMEHSFVPPHLAPFQLPNYRCANYVPSRSTPKVGRNQLCPCGSGTKNKKCCNVKYL